MIARIRHRHLTVDGLRIFYRESLPTDPDAPVLLLLHGFPSASHQYRRLIDALGSQYRLIAPDYPGFGHSDVPESATTGGPFTYSFDRLADITGKFVDQLGLDRFVLYAFDFGAPVGFRLAARHPERIAYLVVQNGNAYTEGSPRWPATSSRCARRPPAPRTPSAGCSPSPPPGASTRAAPSTPS